MTDDALERTDGTWSTAEVAEMFGITEPSVHHHIRRGWLDGVRVEDDSHAPLRITEESVIRYQSECGDAEQQSHDTAGTAELLGLGRRSVQRLLEPTSTTRRQPHCEGEDMTTSDVVTVLSPERLKAARNARKMSREDVARKIGRTASTVSKYELGLLTPSAEMVRTLADALDCPSQTLCAPTTRVSGRP